MIPYPGDDRVGQVQRAYNVRYWQAGRTPDNVLSCVWVARWLYDHMAGLSDEESFARHDRELIEALGMIQQLPPPSTNLPRLRKEGRQLMAKDRRFQWRGVDGYRLAHMVVQGEPIEPYLDWCQHQQITVVRVFTMCSGMFELSPEDGRTALLQVAEKAGARGIYVEAVAVAATKSRGIVWPSSALELHIRTIGGHAATHPNLLIELANEPMQQWQPFTPAQLLDMSKWLPVGIPFTLGAADGPNDESRLYCHPNTTYQNVHADRTRTPLGNVRHVREQQVLSEEIKQFVVNDEPINSKDLSLELNFAMGALERVCQIGGTHHSDWGKMCRVPTGIELEAFQARQRGWNSVPADFWGTFANYGWRAPLPENPVKDATFVDPANSRCYASITDREAYVVLLNITDVRLRDGWSGRVVAGSGAYTVWHCTR